MVRLRHKITLEKVMFELNIPVLDATNMAGDVLISCQNPVLSPQTQLVSQLCHLPCIISNIPTVHQTRDTLLRFSKSSIEQ